MKKVRHMRVVIEVENTRKSVGSTMMLGFDEKREDFIKRVSVEINRLLDWEEKR